MRRARLAAIVLLLASCRGGDRPLLPGNGVDVEVHVKVGKDALQGGEALKCTCCPKPATATCACVKKEEPR